MERVVTVRVKMKDGTTSTFDDVLDIVKTDRTLTIVLTYTTKIFDYDKIKSVLIADSCGKEKING